MTQQLQNASFKVKVGTEPDDEGLIPEKGAMIFNDTLGELQYGDGFNWIALGVAPQADSVATELLTPVSDTYTAATPVTPITVYDNIKYTVGTTITATLGTTYTATATSGVLQISNDFKVNPSVNNTTLTIRLKKNGVTFASRIINMGLAANPVQAAWVNSEAVVSGDVITYEFETDKTCGIILEECRIGMHYQ